MHEKGLHRQIAVGTLVNSQQRRALAVPRLKRWSTAGQPLVNRLFCSSTGLHRIFFFSCLRRDVQNSCLWYPGGLEERLPSRPTEMSAPWFAQLRPAPPSAVRCADPTRPMCVRVLDSTGRFNHAKHVRELVESKTRTYYGRVASGGTAGWGEEGRAGLFANKTVRLGYNPPTHFPKYRRNVALTSPQKNEQAKSYVNRWRNEMTV